MKPKVNNYKIEAGLKKNLVFVSDLHDADNDIIMSAIKECNPDGILVGGDFTHNAYYNKRGFEFLSSAARLCPVYTALGNHESLTEGVRERVLETGSILLDNSFVTIDGLVIGGLTSGYFYEDNLPRLDMLNDFCNGNGYKILLCHHPEYYEKYLKNKRIDLILSGHAHGGQWRFFGRGVYAPGQGLFPKYTSGMYDGKLIVGRGLGSKVRIPRINNRTEIILLKLC